MMKSLHLFYLGFHLTGLASDLLTCMNNGILEEQTLLSFSSKSRKIQAVIFCFLSMEEEQQSCVGSPFMAVGYSNAQLGFLGLAS